MVVQKASKPAFDRQQSYKVESRLTGRLSLWRPCGERWLWVLAASPLYRGKVWELVETGEENNEKFNNRMSF